MCASRELICLTGRPIVGVLTPLIEQVANPSNPVEAEALASRLNELYPHVHVELAYHGQPRENWSIAAWSRLPSASICRSSPRTRSASRAHVMGLRTRCCKQCQK